MASEEVGGVKARLKNSEKRLVEVQSRPLTDATTVEEADIQAEILELNRTIERVWRQMSREIWLKDGDRNTRFFHTATVVRNKRNHIGELLDGAGRVLTTRKDIGEFLTAKYSELFTSSNPSFPSDLEGLITPVITEEDNASLEEIPSADEVRKTVWAMNGAKAPGPDGLQGDFYKRFWDVVGESMVAFVQEFFTNGKLLKAMNFAHVVLIPKTGGADSFDKFRPISLCNFSFKVVTRIITARLRGHLDKMISPFQSAFVPGRWTAENTIVAREVVTTLKRKQGKGGLLGIKIDMSKAYDRVEWSFVFQVLRCFGVSEKMVGIIHQCMSTASFAILLNGCPLERRMASRGLRQGDPLYPYLFIIVTEVLSRLLLREETRGSFHGINIGRTILSISHLMFADDTILFFRARQDEVCAIWSCISKYQEWSGQRVNIQKPGLMFSKNCSERRKRDISGFLGIQECDKEIYYLGNPLFLGRNRGKSFAKLKKRVHDRLEGWMAKSISKAGRTTLVKSVIQSIPSYAMSTFRLPKYFFKS